MKKRKFECKKCLNNCIVLANDYYLPKTCCYDFGYKPDWHEVVDSAENEQFGNSEQLPSNPRKLPDWAKVGEWIYNTKRPEYFKILSLNQLAWISDEIKNGDYIEARKRPFNADEMKDSVGKVLSGDKFDYCALITYTEAEMIETQHYTYTSDELINDYTIDGKPCYVLEHLENGEWVE